MRRTQCKFQAYLDLLSQEQQCRFWDLFDHLTPMSREDRFRFFERADIRREMSQPRTFEQMQGWEPYWRVLDILFWAHDLCDPCSTPSQLEKASEVLDMRYGWPSQYVWEDGNWRRVYPKWPIAPDDLIAAVQRLTQLGRRLENDVYGESTKIVINGITVYEPGWPVEWVKVALAKATGENRK